MTLTKPMVSIIIPIYNAEKSLDRSLDSLNNQTYDTLELIFINDASSDTSPVIIKDFIEGNRDKNFEIKVINHEQNKGVAAARNTGLDVAIGEYVYFLDADDWIEPDAIELMVKEAMSTDADIVGFNWWLSYKKNERNMKQPVFLNSILAIEWMMIGKMRWNLWLFLVKRDLYDVNSIRFIPGMDMGEDMAVMIKLFIYADKVTYLDKALYHYGQSNTESLTKVYSDKHIEEATYNTKELEGFFLSNEFGGNFISLINYLKLNIKLPLLISNQSSQYNRWRSWFAELNHLATANKDVSLHIRLLQWAAVIMQDRVLKLNYYLLIKIMFDVIYK